ncbi:MAG: chitobiase/beta-hexosaminidase C-terminal domain-containing protein [Prevotella sp.]|nr:chitobiase/beta-hexosaminidase C-terminal domain-containing protein [Prevotella sp.]
MNKILRMTLLSLVSMIAGMSYAQTTFDIDTDYATIFPTITGTSSSSTTDGDITTNTTSVAKDGITLTVSPSTGSTANRIWSGSPRLRMYGGTLTISADNATITNISFTYGKWNASNTTDSGTLTATASPATWTGSASSVVLTVAGNTQFKSITVTAVANGTTIVTAPTIEGTTPFVGSTTVTLSAETGAAIYYTTDGTDPTNTSTLYEAPFQLTNTATVKAVAYKDGAASTVASKVFTAAYQASDIADFKAQADKTDQLLTLTNAQVIYADASNTNVYVRDDTGAICFYKAGLDVATGDVLNGTVAGTLSVYNNLPEFVASSLTNADNITKTTGAAIDPVALTVTSAQNNQYLCNLVQISGVKLDSVGSKLFAYQNGDSIQVYDQIKTLTGQTVVTPSENNIITGILVIYKTTYEIYPISAEGVVTTSIADLKAEAANADAPTYNLAGQRVAAGYKGVVIRNGKKFIQR